MAVGIVVSGISRNRGKCGRLMNIEVADVLSKVGLRRLAETADTKAAAHAETDLIAVMLEDLLLRKLLFKLDGDHHLSRFASPVLVLVQPELAGELHAEGRGPLRLVAR